MERIIGEAAGKVWQALSKSPLGLAEVARATKLPADLTNQAIGWLAREGKISKVETARGVTLKLK